MATARRRHGRDGRRARALRQIPRRLLRRGQWPQLEKGTRKCSACCAYKKAKDFSKEEAARPAARRVQARAPNHAPPKPAPKRKSAAPAAKKARGEEAEARPTEEEYHVAKILDRREKPKGKIQYLVKWTGWDDPTWEPSAFVEDTEALDVYLEERQAAAAWDPRTESLAECAAEARRQAAAARRRQAEAEAEGAGEARRRRPPAARRPPSPSRSRRSARAVAAAPVAAAPTTSAPAGVGDRRRRRWWRAEAASDQSVTAEAVAIELVASEPKPPPRWTRPRRRSREDGENGLCGRLRARPAAKACAFGCCGMCCAKMRGMQRCAPPEE